MAPHSSTLAWKIPGTEELGRLQSMGSLNQTWLSDFTFTFHFHALEKEMATHFSVLAWRIPGTGEPGGLPSLGSHRVGHDWSDLAAAKLLENKTITWILKDKHQVGNTQGFRAMSLQTLNCVYDLFSEKYTQPRTPILNYKMKCLLNGGSAVGCFQTKQVPHPTRSLNDPSQLFLNGLMAAEQKLWLKSRISW